MWTFLLGLLGPLGDFIIKLLGLGKPPAEVVEAEKAGASGQAVKDLEAKNAEVQRAADASGTASSAVAGDAGLSKYEQSDPNNRDSKR